VNGSKDVMVCYKGAIRMLCIASNLRSASKLSSPLAPPYFASCTPYFASCTPYFSSCTSYFETIAHPLLGALLSLPLPCASILPLHPKLTLLQKGCMPNSIKICMSGWSGRKGDAANSHIALPPLAMHLLLPCSCSTTRSPRK
jgi:hypothetical protein